MIKPKVVLLIFVSGKIVLTGAKVREEIYTAFNQIYTVLAEFRCVLSRRLPGWCGRALTTADPPRPSAGSREARLFASRAACRTTVVFLPPACSPPSQPVPSPRDSAALDSLGCPAPGSVGATSRSD